MRRTIFTTSLLSALSCLCTQGYSQVGIKPIPDQSLIGQTPDNARNAVGDSLQQSTDQLRSSGNANIQSNAQVQPNSQSGIGGQANINGQLQQNQANAQLQGNVNGQNPQAGFNSQVGANSQAGRINSQVGVNGQAGVTNQNAANARAPQRGLSMQNQYPQNQGTQGWQNGSQSQMAGAGNMMANGGMMAGGMQSSGPMGPVYLLQHEASGREFICVNGSRVYFDQPGTNQNTGTNQFDANTSAVQEQRRAGYGNYDQATNPQAPPQPAQAADPEINNDDSNADPLKAADAKPEEGAVKPSAETEANSVKDAPTLK